MKRRRIAAAFAILRARPDWERYTFDRHCETVAGVLHYTLPEVAEIGRELGYAAPPRPPDAPPLVRTREVMERLGVSNTTVRRLGALCRLTVYGNQQCRLWDPAEVDALAAELRAERQVAA